MEPISAHILTENIALHLEALQSYKDRFGIERKSGEQWLISIKVRENNLIHRVIALVNI